MVFQIVTRRGKLFIGAIIAAGAGIVFVPADFRAGCRLRFVVHQIVVVRIDGQFTIRSIIAALALAGFVCIPANLGTGRRLRFVLFRIVSRRRNLLRLPLRIRPACFKRCGVYDTAIIDTRCFSNRIGRCCCHLCFYMAAVQCADALGGTRFVVGRPRIGRIAPLMRIPRSVSRRVRPDLRFRPACAEGCGVGGLIRCRTGRFGVGARYSGLCRIAMLCVIFAGSISDAARIAIRPLVRHFPLMTEGIAVWFAAYIANRLVIAIGYPPRMLQKTAFTHRTAHIAFPV